MDPKTRRRTLWGIATAALLTTTVLLSLSIAAAAGPWMRGHRGGAEIDEEHVRYVTSRVLRKVDASDAQIDAVVGIALEAHADLSALRSEKASFRDEIEAALTADEIDRDALEALRQDMLELGDAASRRGLEAIADAAAVLRPEQRAELAALHAELRGRFARHPLH